MTKIILIFLGIVATTVAMFLAIIIMDPDKEKRGTLSTQGIKLVGSASVYANGPEAAPTSIKLGALAMAKDRKIYRINEIRKTQDAETVVNVSWKTITKFSSYREYTAMPYTNSHVYPLGSFLLDKTLISEADIIKFYETFGPKELAALEKQRNKNKSNSPVTDKQMANQAITSPELNMVATQASVQPAAPVPVQPPAAAMPAAPQVRVAPTPQENQITATEPLTAEEYEAYVSELETKVITEEEKPVETF